MLFFENLTIRMEKKALSNSLDFKSQPIPMYNEQRL
jgi:hypothetical protein